jgi:hypothetical protein
MFEFFMNRDIGCKGYIYEPVDDRWQVKPSELSPETLIAPATDTKRKRLLQCDETVIAQKQVSSWFLLLNEIRLKTADGSR